MTVEHEFGVDHTIPHRRKRFRCPDARNSVNACATVHEICRRLSADAISSPTTERRRLIDLYEGAIIELPEMQRRATEITSRRKELAEQASQPRRRTNRAHP